MDLEGSISDFSGFLSVLSLKACWFCVSSGGVRGRAGGAGVGHGGRCWRLGARTFLVENGRAGARTSPHDRPAGGFVLQSGAVAASNWAACQGLRLNRGVWIFVSSDYLALYQ